MLVVVGAVGHAFNTWTTPPGGAIGDTAHTSPSVGVLHNPQTCSPAVSYPPQPVAPTSVTGGEPVSAIGWTHSVSGRGRATIKVRHCTDNTRTILSITTDSHAILHKHGNRRSESFRREPVGKWPKFVARRPTCYVEVSPLSPRSNQIDASIFVNIRAVQPDSTVLLS